MDKVSIIMPIYNRNNFKHLIINNLLRLDYSLHDLEFVMLDDGDDKFIKSHEEYIEFENIIKPIKFNYKWEKKRMEIGVKRNKLVKQSSYNIIACMDSDDIYMSDYISYSVNLIKNSRKGLVGSNQMLFCYPLDNFLITGIQCGEKRMIHEATMVFTKKHWRAMGGFKKNSQGEGVSMIDGMNSKTIGLTEIHKIMICLCHSTNTINKDRFKKDKLKNTPELDDYDKELILSCLSNVKHNN